MGKLSAAVADEYIKSFRKNMSGGWLSFYRGKAPKYMNDPHEGELAVQMAWMDHFVCIRDGRLMLEFPVCEGADFCIVHSFDGKPRAMFTSPQ